MRAAQAAHLDCARLLIEKGADIAFENKDSDTALMFAAYIGNIGNVESARLLIDRGAVVNATQEGHRSALARAAVNGHLECARLLIEKGADVDSSDELGFSAFNGHPKCVCLLVEKKADVNAQDQKGSSVLMKAVGAGHLECVRLLIEKGADIHAADELGYTPLIYAVYNGHLECVRLLIKKGAVVNVADHGGFTPLIFAASDGHVDCAHLLIDNGADVDAAENKLRTALMCACEGGKSEIVRVLVERGARLDARSQKDRRAIDFAQGAGHEECVRILKDVELAKMKERRAKHRQGKAAASGTKSGRGVEEEAAVRARADQAMKELLEEEAEDKKENRYVGRSRRKKGKGKSKLGGVDVLAVSKEEQERNLKRALGMGDGRDWGGGASNGRAAEMKGGQSKKGGGMRGSHRKERGSGSEDVRGCEDPKRSIEAGAREVRDEEEASWETEEEKEGLDDLLEWFFLSEATGEAWNGGKRKKKTKEAKHETTTEGAMEEAMQGEDGGPAWGRLDPEVDSCVVCMVGRREWVLLPCLHESLCGECAKVFRLADDAGELPFERCPLCRCELKAP